jgi:hypothetical protein
MNFGKILSALNPLDAHGMSQIMKAGNQSGWQKLVGIGKAIGGSFNARRYLSGRNLRVPGAPGGGRIPRADRLYRSRVRKTAAVGVGAWAGLNLMDPNSGGTWAANTAAMGAAGVVAYPAVKSLAAKYAGQHAAKVSGGYAIGGTALMANRLLGVF